MIMVMQYYWTVAQEGDARDGRTANALSMLFCLLHYICTIPFRFIPPFLHAWTIIIWQTIYDNRCNI